MMLFSASIIILLINIRLTKTTDQKDLPRPLKSKGTCIIEEMHASLQNLDKQLRKLQRKHRDEMQNLTDRHTADMQTIQSKLNRLSSKHNRDLASLEQRVTSLQNKHNQDVNGLRSKHSGDVNTIQRKHEDDLKRLEAKHDKDIRDLSKCPSKLPHKFRDFCYGVFQERKSWQSAQSHCQSLGANLVWIDDSSEEGFIVRTLMTKSPWWAWIGANDRVHEGRFVWVHNNQPVTYTKWTPGEPNNAANEDCCLLYHGGGWNDAECTHANNYICKA